MKPIDLVKALGVAFVALVLNLALTTLAITVYSVAIAPGRPAAFYTAMAPRIATWTAPPGGALLLFALVYLLTKRRPDRAALAFGGAVAAAYVLIDGGSGLAMGGLNLVFAVSMTLAVLGALGGAWAAQRG